MAASYNDFYAYGCGLTLLALAGLIFAMNRQHPAHRGVHWLVGFGIAQALVEWSALALDPARQSTPTVVALLEILSLVALTEFGRCNSITTKVVDGRWIYVPLAAVLIGCAAGGPEWFTLGISVLIAVQGALLIARFWIQSLAHPAWPRVHSACALAALAFLLASVLDSGASKFLSMLLVVITLWIIAANRRRPATYSATARQFGFPIAFCALLLGGGLFFANDQRLPEHLLAEQQEQIVQINDAESLGGAVGSVWLQACCLALAPPLILIAATWVVSRLRGETARVGI